MFHIVFVYGNTIDVGGQRGRRQSGETDGTDGEDVPT